MADIHLVSLVVYLVFVHLVLNELNQKVAESISVHYCKLHVYGMQTELHRP